MDTAARAASFLQVQLAFESYHILIYFKPEAFLKWQQAESFPQEKPTYNDYYISE